MPDADLNQVRRSVLDSMERADRARTLAIAGAGIAEALLLGLGVWLVNWDDRTQVLVLLFAVLTYMIVAFGLLALGSHVSRNTNYIIGAIQDAYEEPDH